MNTTILSLVVNNGRKTYLSEGFFQILPEIADCKDIE